MNSDYVRDSDTARHDYEAYNLQQLRPSYPANHGKSHGNQKRKKALRPHPIPPDTVYFVEASYDNWMVFHFLENAEVRHGTKDADLD